MSRWKQAPQAGQALLLSVESGTCFLSRLSRNFFQENNQRNTAHLEQAVLPAPGPV